MPGVLIMETLAQTAGVLGSCKPENKGKAVLRWYGQRLIQKTSCTDDQLVMTAFCVHWHHNS